jgi:glycosyltransferase involved in cell wall biosynthesis
MDPSNSSTSGVNEAALGFDDSESSLVSVVIPCFNEGEVLEELYQRLSEAVKEWEDALEVVLVDDGSTDAT